MRVRTMSLGVVPLVVVVCAAALLTACGGGPPQKSPTPSAISITPAAQTGTTTSAKVGDTVSVYLDANPTTGYEWGFTPGDTMAIVRSKWLPDPNSEGMAGAGGTQVITVRVTKAGESDLTGMYQRNWETPAPGKPSFSMTIVSTD